MSNPQGLCIMTDSMAYPDPIARNRSIIEYQYSPTTINHTQYSAFPTILGGEYTSTGTSHWSDSEFDAGIDEPSDHYTPNWRLHVPSSSRTSLEFRAGLSNNILPSCNCFSSSRSSRQSMAHPLTYSFYQLVDNHRESDDHYQANPVLTDSSQYQFSESDGGSAPSSPLLNSHRAHSPQPEVYSPINGSITSSQGLASTSRSFAGRASKPEESEGVFPRVLNDMYDRVEHAFRALGIYLRDSATVHPESYPAEVDAYLSFLNECSYHLFLRGYRAKTFTKRDHEYLAPFYLSIYSPYHRMEIGFIRHLVHHAIKRLRRDIQRIEVHELQDAEKAKNHGYSDEHDFDPNENRIIVDKELVNLEKKLRSVIGPFWETDNVLYWQSLQGQETRFSFRSKSIIGVLNGEVGYLVFIKMLRCSVLGVEAMFQNVRSLVHLGGRDEVAKKQIITAHIKDLKSSLFRFLCSTFPESLSNDLVMYWIEGKQKHPTRTLFLQDLIPALRTRKHMIMKNIREIATEDLEKIKRRQAIEDCAAIERELEDFEKQLVRIDREWNNQRLLSLLKSGIEVSDHWNLEGLKENDTDALRELLPDMKSLGLNIISSLREMVPELQSIDEVAFLSAIVKYMATHHNKDQSSSIGTGSLNVSQTFQNGVRSRSSCSQTKESIWRPIFTDEVEETGTPYPVNAESISQSSVFQSEQVDNINTPLSTPNPTSLNSTRSDSPALGHKCSYRQILGLDPIIPGPSSKCAKTMPREPEYVKSPELLHTEIHLVRTWENIQRSQQLKALDMYSQYNLTSGSKSCFSKTRIVDDWKRGREHALIQNEVIREQLNITGCQGQQFLENAIAKCDEKYDEFLHLFIPNSSENASHVDGGKLLEVERGGKDKEKGKAVEWHAESGIDQNDYISDDEHFFGV